MPTLQIKLLVIFHMFGGFQESKLYTLKPNITRICRCFHGLPLWAQLSFDAALEAEHPRRLQGVHILPHAVMCGFPRSVPVSLLEYSVLSNILTAVRWPALLFKKKCFHEVHFLILKIQSFHI